MPYEFTEQYTRNTNDFYIEPRWCIEALLRNSVFIGNIHDPACGSGKIPTVCRDFVHVDATGADIVDRAFAGVILQDYLKDKTIYDNIITNPPYTLSEAFILHALQYTRSRIAVLARIAFL